MTTLRTLAARPNTAVVANGAYDAAYAEYFAGLRNVVVLPSLCRSAGPSWVWRRTQMEGSDRLPVLLDVCDDVRCPPFRQASVLGRPLTPVSFDAQSDFSRTLYSDGVERDAGGCAPAACRAPKCS